MVQIARVMVAADGPQVCVVWATGADRLGAHAVSSPPIVHHSNTPQTILNHRVAIRFILAMYVCRNTQFGCQTGMAGVPFESHFEISETPSRRLRSGA